MPWGGGTLQHHPVKNSWQGSGAGQEMHILGISSVHVCKAVPAVAELVGAQSFLY